MSKQSTNIPKLEPLIDVTWSVTSDKKERFVSVISTHRTPTANEMKRADWHKKLVRGGLRIHVVGRGDELSPEYLKQLAMAYADGLPVWKNVDLTRPEAPIRGFPESATWQEIMRTVNNDE